jgi:hypothetical protein
LKKKKDKGMRRRRRKEKLFLLYIISIIISTPGNHKKISKQKIIDLKMKKKFIKLIF